MNSIWDRTGTKVSVIHTLLKHGPLSRIELSRTTELSRATITLAVSELIEMNLVHETNNRYSTGGRPATLLELSPSSRAIIGADFSNQTWTLGAFDLLGNTFKTETIPVIDSSVETVIQALTSHLQQFVATLEIPPIELVGLGMPGLIEVSRGVIHSASDLGWYNVEIAKMVEERTQWPTLVVNRHRARGLAECRFGTGKEFKSVVYIGIGTGIASGLFYDSQLMDGAMGGAGEIGHMTIEPHGPLCPCGNQGCLQMLATEPVMEQEARRLLKAGQTSSIYPDPRYDLQLIKAVDICRGADQGDKLCMEVVENAATYQGIAMANLVNILNPDAIILGGTIPSECDYYVHIATQVMHHRALSPLHHNVKILKATHTRIGGALGAASFALDENIRFSIFNTPS